MCYSEVMAKSCHAGEDEEEEEEEDGDASKSFEVSFVLLLLLSSEDFWYKTQTFLRKNID